MLSKLVRFAFRALFTALVAFWVIYTGVYFKLNDRVLGRFISGIVSGAERGTFSLGAVHYQYLGGFLSILFNTPTRVYGLDYKLTDPEGNPVIAAVGIEADAHLRELVIALAQIPLSGGQTHVTLHLSNARVPRGYAVITSTQSSFGAEAHDINVVASFTSRKPPSNQPSASELRIIVDQIVIEDFDFALGMPNADGNLAFAGIVHHARAVGELYLSSAKRNETADGPYFFFQVHELDANEGRLRMGTFEFPLRELHVREFGSTRPRRQDLDFIGTTQTYGAALKFTGTLTDVFGKHQGIRLKLGFEHGGAVGQVLPPPLDTWFSGDASGELDVNGPFENAAVGGRVQHVSAKIVGLEMTELASGFSIDDAPALHLQPEGKVGGGTIKGKVDVALATGGWKTRVELAHVDPSRLTVLPEGLRSFVKGRLHGGADLRSDAHSNLVRISNVKATLERDDKTQLDVAGNIDYGATSMRIAGGKLSLSGTTLAVDGRVGVVKPTLDLTLALAVADGGPLLTFARAPKSLALSNLSAIGKVTGTLTSPNAAIELGIGHLAYLDRSVGKLRAHVVLDHGVVSTDDVTAELTGGTFGGSVSAALFSENAFPTLRAKPQLDAKLHGDKLDLAQVAQVASVKGQLAVTLALSGPLASPTGTLKAQVTKLELGRDHYRDGAMAFAFTPDGIAVEPFSFARQKGGGIAGKGRVGYDGALAIELSPSQFPFQGIPYLAAFPIPVTGSFSGKVSLEGTTKKPHLSASISIRDAHVRDIDLGDGSLNLVQGAESTRFEGVLRRLSLAGYLRLSPEFAVDATLRFADLELEKLFPQLRKLTDVEGLATGQAHVIADATHGLQSATLELGKLQLTLQGEDENGRPRHLVVRNQDEVLFSSDAKGVRFQQVHLISEDGELTASGLLATQDSNFKLHGQIGLELLEYFTRDLFEHTHGDAFVDLSMRGSILRPEVEGSLDLRKAVLTPRGFAEEQRLVVPSGRITLTETSVQLSDLNLILDGLQLRADGRMAIADWQPGEISGRIEGQASPKFLQWLLSDQFADATGKVDLNVELGGRWGQPKWQGRAAIDNVAFYARRLGRRVVFTQGTMSFVNYDVALGCPNSDFAAGQTAGCLPIKGILDESSPFQITGGLAIGANWSFKNIDVKLNVTDVRYSTTEYSLTLGTEANLRGSSNGLELSGNLDIIEGRYTRPFDVTDLVFKPRAVEATVPAWQGNPLLETMKLHVAARSTGPLYVKNNVAELVLATALDISGTLSDPKLSGVIRVEEGGTLKPPTWRFPFTTNSGQVIFDPDKSIPAETPTLDLSATGSYTDRADTTHSIFLRLTGTVQNPQPLMTSPEGWDQGAILQAVLSGLTPDEARRLGQTDPTARTTSRNGSASEALTKSATGTLLNQLISDPIRRVIGFDTTSIEFGANSADALLCKRFGRYLKTCGQGEFAFVGSSTIGGYGELKMAEWFSALGRVDYLTRAIETFQQSVTRAKFELNLRIPLGY